MKEHKVNSIINMSSEERYLYFIRKTTDFEEVWGLFNNGWAMLGDENNENILPFWPEREFAQIAAEGKWKDFSPKVINIYDFIEKWLPGMAKDNNRAGIFYIPSGKGIVVKPTKLKEDIEEELKQYE